MIAGIVLAAGESRRMGQPKQLMHVGLFTMLNRVVDAALGSKLDAVYVVLGHLADEIEGTLRDPSAITVIRNTEYKEGMAASVRAGVAALPSGCDAAMFLLADQPFITRQVIDQLLPNSTPNNIVAPSLAGERKNPTVFGRDFFPELLQLTGDTGGRSVLQAHSEALVLVELAEDYRDVDTPDDARALLSPTATRRGRGGG